MSRRRDRVVAALPLGLALAAVAAVWLAGCVWSFEEQTDYASAKGFAVPQLLPLVLDGLAVALAGVAYAAALDGRAAVQARAMTAVAVAASALSNASWAFTRTGGDGGAVALAAGVPVAANLAFEVLLGELRRQVHRRRGLPAPVAVPWPRVVRLALAPAGTWREWRREVLALTAPSAGAEDDGATVAELEAELVEARRRAEEAAAWLADAEDLRGQIAALEAEIVQLHLRPPGKRVAAAGRTHGGGTTSASVPDDVLATGRRLAKELAARGEVLTRRTLTAAFRDAGQSLSSDRAGALLRELRA